MKRFFTNNFEKTDEQSDSHFFEKIFSQSRDKPCLESIVMRLLKLEERICE
jgi:hypothetical protein